MQHSSQCDTSKSVHLASPVAVLSFHRCNLRAVCLLRRFAFRLAKTDLHLSEKAVSSSIRVSPCGDACFAVSANPADVKLVACHAAGSKFEISPIQDHYRRCLTSQLQCREYGINAWPGVLKFFFVSLQARDAASAMCLEPARCLANPTYDAR